MLKFLFDRRISVNALIICFPEGRPPGTLREPRGIVQFVISFFPRGGGELFSFGNDLPGPQGQTRVRVLVSGISL